ncbi:MAG TPA: amidohydrolase family protein [Holophagaceae bacterium]|nr:amidohydrolase family protein [Holophagaceae bacterium]
MALLAHAAQSVLLLSVLGLGLGAQAPTLRNRLGTALEAVPAIDHHTHLLEKAPYAPEQDGEAPLLMRSTHPAVVKVLRERFGVDWDPRQGQALHAAASAARQARMDRLGGEVAYWADHLRSARVDLALVNQVEPLDPHPDALRWVPTASPLLLPFPAASLEARSPLSAEELPRFRAALLRWMKADGRSGPSPTLAAYLRFLDRQLRTWQAQGAVALKFVEAYHRSLRFEAVGQVRAEALWRTGQARSLRREEYLTLQDFLARHLFREAGALNLPVHVHTGLGGSPRLQLQEADPRNLEATLADPAFHATTFVLIHAGTPDPRTAAAMAAFRPHVWLDLSGLAFHLPPDELATAVRACLLAAPERTLFGTDAYGCHQIPVGPEVVQLAFSPILRQALTEALASLVEAGLLEEARALQMGRDVLRGNARRLYRWDAAAQVP